MPYRAAAADPAPRSGDGATIAPVAAVYFKSLLAGLAAALLGTALWLTAESWMLMDRRVPAPATTTAPHPAAVTPAPAQTAAPADDFTVTTEDRIVSERTMEDHVAGPFALAVFAITSIVTYRRLRRATT